MCQANDYRTSTAIDKQKLLFKKTRRRHKNSKNGCLNCKQRKLKCNEDLPICSFCERRGFECSFLTMTPFQIHQICISHSLNKRRSLKKQRPDNEDNDEGEEEEYANGDDYEEEWDEDEEDGVENDDSYTPIFDDNALISDQSYYLSTNDTNTNLNSYSPDFHSSYDPGDFLTYQTTKEINLKNSNSNLNAITTSNFMYQAREIEGILLPHSMGTPVLNKVNANRNAPFQIGNKINQHRQQQQQQQHPQISPNNIPLHSNSKIVNKTFKTNNFAATKSICEFINKSEVLGKALRMKDLNLICLKFGPKVNIDVTLFTDFLKSLTICQIFSKLLRKSLLLLSINYFKNIILKQSILPLIRYPIKISIASTCQNASVKSINEITKILKNDYLPNYNELLEARVSLLTGCFLVLNYSLVFHFKNGLKYDINIKEGENSVKLLGIFTTGLYSIVMERSREDFILEASDILSAILSSDFKAMLKSKLSIEPLFDLKKMLDSLSNRFLNDIDYENLRYFLDKYLCLLEENYNPNTLLCYNNGFIIRLLNSFQSIIPRNLCNLNPNFKGKPINESKIIIFYFYLTMAGLLEEIMPATKAFAANGFFGTGWVVYNIVNPSSLMETYKLIQSKDLKIIAIQLIRLYLYTSTRRISYQRYLKSISINQIVNLNEDDEDDDVGGDSNDKESLVVKNYAALLKFRDTLKFRELPVKSFIISKGQFFQTWNYANSDNLKPKRSFKVANNKILHVFKNDDEMIENFEQSGNGTFTYDFNPKANVIVNKKPISEGMVFIDGSEMKMLWKLLVYIRINNL